MINRLIVRWPKLTLLWAFLLTAFLGYQAWHLRIDSSAENLYSQDDPNKKYDEAMRKIFGSDDMGVIGLVTENIYTPATLEKIQRITAEVEQIVGVERVQSLTNVPDATTAPVNPPLLIPRIPTDQAALDSLRRKVEHNPIYLNMV